MTIEKIGNNIRKKVYVKKKTTKTQRYLTNKFPELDEKTLKDIDVNIPYTKVDDTSEYQKNILANEYGYLINKLKLIGVNGTNGKTTVTHLIQKLYEDYLGTPNSHLAHELLHTHYMKKDVYIKKLNETK